MGTPVADKLNSNELCENWGWYVDIENQTKNKKYKSYNNYKNYNKYSKYIFKVKIYANENNNDYFMYSTTNKNKIIKSNIFTLESIQEEEDEKKNVFLNSSYLIKITSAISITCLLTYIILFSI